MITAIAAIFVFLMVILFHEFGHFAVAKMVNIKVNEFSIGMGPKLIQKTKGETKYSLRALPIGGFVSMEGEDENSDDPRSFNKVPAISRIAVVLAGAIMNFFLAIIVLSIVSYNIGLPTTIVMETLNDSPAKNAGILSEDKIISINNNEINNWESITKEIGNSNPDEEMKIMVLRGSSYEEISLYPAYDEDGRVIIGIVPQSVKGIGMAIKGGFEKTGSMLMLMFQFVKMIFQGRVSTQDLSGPVGVIYTIGEAAKYGITDLLYLMGFISINLGFFNLFPLPALDGSRAIFLFIELVRGKAIDPKKEGFIHFVGFILLALLMLTVTYSDIIRFNLFGR